MAQLRNCPFTSDKSAFHNHMNALHEALNLPKECAHTENSCGRLQNKLLLNTYILLVHCPSIPFLHDRQNVENVILYAEKKGDTNKREKRKFYDGSTN